MQTARTLDFEVRDKQVNFKTNTALLEKAKLVFKKKHVDATTVFNRVLEDIVETQELPFVTADDEEYIKLKNQLIFEVNQSYQEFLDGKGLTQEEFDKRLGL